MSYASEILEFSTVPSEVSCVLSLDLSPFDELDYSARLTTYWPCDFKESHKVRVGPLELWLEAGLCQPDQAPPSELVCYLKCATLATAFPWAGTVDANLRILNGNGKPITADVQPETDDYVESESPSSTLKVGNSILYKPYRSSWDLMWHYAARAFKKDIQEYADKKNNALHIQVTVSIKVTLKPAAEGNWLIPLSLLNLKTGNLTNNADILESQEWSDIEIESTNGDRIRAHRVILAGCSQVFKNMFKADNKENMVKVDIGSKGLKIMLKFMYTGALVEEIADIEGLDTEVFFDLLRAGEKYELPLLMKFAGVALMLRCTRENAWELFVALKKYGKDLSETWAQIAEFIHKTVDQVCKMDN